MMATAERQQPLPLDTGVSRPKRKPSTSCFKCACVTLVGIVVFLVAFVLFTLASVVHTSIQTTRFPHKEELYNPLNASHTALPVIPLVDHNTTFDIGVTVWLTPTEPVILARRRQRLEVAAAAAADMTLSQNGAGARAKVESREGHVDVDAKGEKGIINTEEDDNELDKAETALFSDVVFAGLRLQDKHVTRMVNFTLPTARFCGLNLSRNDVRASFVLIPNSPSPMDRARNFSTWYPADMTRRPERSWPFPLHSTETGPKTLVDEIIEAFAVSYPLVNFNILPNPSADTVSNATSTSAAAKPIPGVESELEVDGDDDYDGGDNAGTANADDEEDKVMEADTKALAESERERAAFHSLATPPHHLPQLVQRTHLRLIDSVDTYELRAFNNRHNKLKATGCGQLLTRKRNRMTESYCFSSWEANGPFKNRVQLALPVEEGEKPRFQRAYTPYFSVNPSGHGAMDLIDIPVNRSSIAKAENGTYLPLDSYDSCIKNDTIDISWLISFSGRSPTKVAFADTFLRPNQAAHNASDYARIMAQHSAETINGLAGHYHYPDSHPRRRFFIDAFWGSTGLILYFLRLHYWHSRQTTVGLAVGANAVSALCEIGIGTTQPFVQLELWKKPWDELLLNMGLMTIERLPAICQLKAVSRLDFGWRSPSSWVPRVGFAPASHRERASGRSDRQTSYCLLIGAALVTAGVYFFFDLNKIYVVRHLLPPKGPDDISKTPRLYRFCMVAGRSVWVSTEIAQYLLSERQSTFARAYKSATLLELGRRVLSFAGLFRLVVGRYDAQPGWSSDELLCCIVLVARARQAINFPSVTQDQVDEDDE